MEKKLHLYNSKSDYLNEKDSFTPIYNVSYVIDTDEVLYNLVSRQGDTPIVFADSEVKRLCVENWGSGGEITYDQAAAVTDLSAIFWRNTAITSFNELQYFTGLQGIGERAFNGCSSLTSVTIPDGVTIIDVAAFNGCENLISVTIPDGVTTIGGYAFGNCSSLTSVTIPNTVITIEEAAFRFCSSLTSITIPDSVANIYQLVFNGCSKLTSITSLALTAPTINYKTFQNVPTGGTLYVPSGATGYDVWWMKNSVYFLGNYKWTLSTL